MQAITEPTRRGKWINNKKALLKVDMTPMVDLGFLLITFFIVTTEILKPAVSDLYMPHDGPPGTLAEKNALSILLPGGNAVVYYQGSFENALINKQIFMTNFSGENGIRSVIQKVQSTLDKNQPGGKKYLMLLVKPTDETSYRDVINTLDEVLINSVKKYTIVELSADEKSFLKKMNH
jgi:Biopolymer transport protein ExbD/TolR.